MPDLIPASRKKSPFSKGRERGILKKLVIAVLQDKNLPSPLFRKEGKRKGK
jgi:hypothetical protein